MTAHVSIPKLDIIILKISKDTVYEGMTIYG